MGPIAGIASVPASRLIHALKDRPAPTPKAEVQPGDPRPRSGSAVLRKRRKHLFRARIGDGDRCPGTHRSDLTPEVASRQARSGNALRRQRRIINPGAPPDLIGKSARIDRHQRSE